MLMMLINSDSKTNITICITTNVDSYKVVDK